MNMGGLIGSVQMDMQGLEDFWPYLWLGQWTHVGKGTSMGMGAYSISENDVGRCGSDAYVATKKSTSLPTARTQQISGKIQG
jgi:hypothetical protein